LKILIFNQYFFPDTEATAQWLSNFCECLLPNHFITVVCGHSSCPSQEECFSNKIRTIRVPSTIFNRSNMIGRLSNYFSFIFSSFLYSFYLLLKPKPDLIISMTDPPIIGLIAWFVSAIKRAPFLYIIQDLHPDVAIVIGRLKNRLVIKIIDSLHRFLYKRADQIVAISTTMKERLLLKGVPDYKITVIPNWTDIHAITPQHKKNQFSLEHGLDNSFNIMYSGNIGLSQNLHLLIESAKSLQELKDLKFIFIGDGAKKLDLVNQVKELNLKNVHFFDYQPIDKMAYSFGTADIFVVPLASGLDGLIVPSKVFSIMASGRSFIAAIDEMSEVAQIANKFSCGFVIEPGDINSLSETIREAYHSREQLKVMGLKGRKAVEEYYSSEISMSKYENVFLKSIESHKSVR
jgi:colanic acid biosynthesis glycosyl transferase WcaI